MFTYLLVHGALLTSSSWMPVQSYLQNHGYNVITMDVPGRAQDEIAPKDVSLKLAAQKLCKIAYLQSNKVILVGHSQAGAIITKATNLCAERIAALVYVAAVVPHNGEKAFDLLSTEDGANFDKVAPLDETAGVYKINYQGPIKIFFMDDATDSIAQHAINDMVPEPARIGDEVLQYDRALFEQTPKFYIKTTEDKIISPSTQDAYLSRDQFKKIFVMHTSHSPFISQPKQLANYLISISNIIK